MIKKIYSKVEKDLLLHIVFSPNQKQNSREDIVPSNNFLQCSFLQMEKGKTFKPHKHVYKNRTYEKQIAQESWFVLSGKVKCTLYDIDDTIIDVITIGPGEASFTLVGGHNYEILEENTMVYEYKTGPYEGQALDKEFIENK